MKRAILIILIALVVATPAMALNQDYGDLQWLATPWFDDALYHLDPLQVTKAVQVSFPYVPLTVDGETGNVLICDFPTYYVPTIKEVREFLASTTAEGKTCAYSALDLYSQARKIDGQPWAIGIARLDMVRGQKAKHVCLVVLCRASWTADVLMLFIDQSTDRLWVPSALDHIYSITM